MKNFIVFDLEWNQNPGGKEASVERLPFEIFEIGAVKLHEEREKVAEFHRIIRPCVYRQMHRIISEVTHVSIEELERDGEPFAAEETERPHLPRRRPAFMSQRKAPSQARMWSPTRMITTVLMN